MKLCPLPFTLRIYTIFQDLYDVANVYASKKDYIITIKQSKNNKNGKL